MLASFSFPHSAVSIVIAVAKNHGLAASVVERVLHPTVADGFNGEKAARTKAQLLRDQHTFKRANGMGKDEDAFAIGEVIRGKRFQACHRAAHGKLKVGLGRVAGRTATLALSVFVHAHGDEAALSEAV